MDKQIIVEKGTPIRMDGIEGWMYRPDSEKDDAWLLLKNWNAGTEPEKVSWQQEWEGGSFDLMPDSCFAEELGISDLDELLENPREAWDRIWCPFCLAHFASRFEVRESKNQCEVCQGSGDRAIKAIAVVAAWTEEIRSSGDVDRAKKLIARLCPAYYRSEIRTLIRAAQSKSG